MATETAHLPLISSKQVSYTTKNRPERDQSDGKDDKEKKGNSEKLSKAANYLASFGLGNVQREPRPGDVYRRPRTTSNAGPRPLGLIPDRGERINALRELTKLLTTPPKSALAQTIVQETAAPKDAEIYHDGMQQNEESASQRSFRLISATVDISRADEGKKAGKASQSEEDPDDFPFRLSARPHRSPEALSSTENQQPPLQEVTEPVKDDREYRETLAQCDIKKYGISDFNTGQNIPGPGRHPHTTASIANQVQTTGNKPPKRGNRLGRPDNRSTNLEYFSFINQAQLGHKKLTDGRRDALDYIPCERCRLRGGRCSKCKTLRTGGGYIILDGMDASTNGRPGRHSRYGYRGGAANLSGSGDGLDGRLRGKRREDEGGERTGWDGGGDNHGGDNARGLGGRGGTERDGGSYGKGGWGWEGGGGAGEGRGGLGGAGGGGNDGTGGGGRLRSAHNDEGTYGRREGQGRMGDEHDRGTGAGGDSSGRTDTGGAGQGRPRGEGGESDGHESGRQSVSSQRPGSHLGSRPGSRLGSRPGSSLRKMGWGVERRERTRRGGGEVERSKGGKVKARYGGDDDSESGSEDEDGKRRRRRRRGGADGEGEDEGCNGMDKGRRGYDFGYHQEGEDEEQRGPYTGDLMRFRSRRDDMKALQCTLKELQGIDPLDYLAKYCIIDQEKVPNYRRVYDNVDRDEDDEIDIMELDFALKAVNYDLISDAEMNYVHSVLELAGRYRLNFRLFSLIAALSEKVVALDDMVKRLINKMDFEALEVKMKKCKELFYLLADAERESRDEGGVVTTSSLAVELQAGGLTSEHVEFVVNRLNHQNKGIVEFLDYLTYVPLFVEIHDSISGNPLDFSRTK